MMINNAKIICNDDPLFLYAFSNSNKIMVAVNIAVF